MTFKEPMGLSVSGQLWVWVWVWSLPPACLPSLPPILGLPAQVGCSSWHSLPQGGAGPWWMAQVEARQGDRQGTYAAVAQVGFPFLVMCVLCLTTSFWSPPLLCQMGAPSPHLRGFSPAHLSWEWQVKGLNGLDERGHSHGNGSLSSPTWPGYGEG